MEPLDLRLLTDVTNFSPSSMGPKPKGRLGRPHQQGTTGKRSPKKRVKRKIEDEEDSDDDTLGKGKLPARGQRESRNKYSLTTKVQAIERMASGKMVSSVSDEMKIPVGMVSQWWLQRDDIRAAYEREVFKESGQDMVEEHIRMSQEDFDRKRMEKFLASNPEQPAMFQPHKRQHPSDPVSDDSVADPDEDFSAEEYMRKRKKATPSPSSEEDVGSWSMSFVNKSPPVKAKNVAKNKIKDMPSVKDSENQVPEPQSEGAASHLKKGKKSSKSPRKGGSGSSARMMNQIKKIKKDQKQMRKPDTKTVKTSTYEVKDSTTEPNKVAKPDIEVPGWRVVESPPKDPSPFERALSPSPPPEREIESGSSSLILQSPSQVPEPAWKSRTSTVEKPDLTGAKVSDSSSIVDSRPAQVKVKTEVPSLNSPALNISSEPQPARKVKSEPAPEEYVESREADASSIASEDGNLMDFLEKVKKPEENNELVDRYYSPFGLKTGDERPTQVNPKLEMLSPQKDPSSEQFDQYSEGFRAEEDKGAVSPPRSDLLAAYPAIQFAPSHPPAVVQHSSPAVSALQQIPGLQVVAPSNSMDRRSSVDQLQQSQNQYRSTPLVRKPSIEEIGEVVTQPPTYPLAIPSNAQPHVYSPRPTLQRGGGSRARGRARGSPLVRPVMSPQVRTPMARGTLPPGVRMRMRGQPVRGSPRPMGRGLPAGQSPIMGGRGRIVQRGQLNQVRGAVRGQPAGRVLVGGRGRASPRPQLVRGAAQPIRARQPGPRIIMNNQGVRSAAPRYQSPQPLAYNGAPQGARLAQPRARFASPRGSPMNARGGMVPQRGGQLRGQQPTIRGRGQPVAHQQPQQVRALNPVQGRPGEAKRKVTVELSDRQLAALKQLGIM